MIFYNILVAKINKKQHLCIVTVTSTCYCIVPLLIRINQGGLPLIKDKKKKSQKKIFTEKKFSLKKKIC